MITVAEDADLIRRAEQWATGATIHDVKAVIGLYRSGLIIANDPHGRASPRKRLWGLALADVATARLEAFMRHGDRRRADRENPLPREPLAPDAGPRELAEYHRWNLEAARGWLDDVGEPELARTVSPLIKAAMRRMS
jgi:hypothetical protein